AHPVQRGAPEHAEVAGVGGPGGAADVEGRGAHADLGGRRAGDGLLEGGDALGRHHAADVVGSCLVQGLDRYPQVVGREHGVAVDPGDDAVAGGGDGGVERVGRAAGGVGDDDHPAVGGGDLVGDLLCAVLRRSDGEDDFDLAGVLLGEDLVDGFAEMALLVQDRHDDGDGGPATRLRWRVRRVGELL